MGGVAAVRVPGGLRRRWPLLALLAGLVVAALLLTASAAARDSADRFLQTFRARRAEPLTIIDVQLPALPGVSTDTLSSSLRVDVPHGASVATSHDAQDRVDFNVRSMRRSAAPHVEVLLGQTATLRLDRAALERVLSGALLPGVRLPRELDAPMYAHIDAAVRQSWSEPGGDITLWTLRNPRLYTTDGPPWEELRAMLIQALFVLTPERARDLQQVNDWERTVVVPVPPEATVRRVRADNVEGALLIEQAGRSMLVWQRYGAVHVLDAPLPGPALVRMADGLR